MSITRSRWRLRTIPRARNFQKMNIKSSLSLPEAILPISPDEWDFTDCPDSEISNCYYYEYARESTWLIELVEQKREKGWNSGLYPGDWEYYEQAWFSRFFMNLPEFPEVPWLRIPRAKRAHVCAECNTLTGPFVSVGAERLPEDPNMPLPYFPHDVGILS